MSGKPRFKTASSKEDYSFAGQAEVLHNLEVEQALLGALISSNDVMDNLPDYFAPCHFAGELHSKIFETIKNIRDQGSPADPLTITAYLKDNELFQKANGHQYLIDLAMSTVSITNAPSYARITYDLYLRRQIVQIGEETVIEAKHIELQTDAMSVIENTEKKLYDLVEGSSERGRLHSFKEALDESMSSARAAYERDSHIIGVSSGFRDLDKWLGGLHKSDLRVVAGRPSMGKTAFATNIAFNAAKLKLQKSEVGSPVVFFSLEMSAEQLATRILASESEIPSDRIRRGEIRGDALKKFYHISKDLGNLELFIDDTPNITVNQIRNRVRRLKRKREIGLVVIDYLQLIESSSLKKNADTRVAEVSEITRALKGLAKEMNVPVIALSQLSRAVEQREDKKPQLADLRESGSIEQDADVVMFIFREEYYKARKEPPEDTVEHDKWQLEMERTYNRAEIIIAKQRHGPVGTIKLFFDGKLTRFGNLAE
jgi:replicative DNA helicase